jgi:cyclophilin family peptidyl-prolyl cis-trans isomerase/HEAT repeat protein
MARVLPLLVTAALLLYAPAAAGDATDDARAVILLAELSRGPAAPLAPYLAPDADPVVRRLAVRALGRIGDRAGAPELLEKLLTGGGPDMPRVLWAAGVSGSKRLEGPVARHLDSTDPAVVAAAAAVIGWIGGDEAAAKVAALLEHRDPGVVASALTGLALLKREGYLERASRFVRAPDPRLRAAAQFACWHLAGARRTAAKKLDPEWGGDEPLCEPFLALLLESDAEQRMAGVRVMGILAPRSFVPDSRLGKVFGVLLDDPDPRVVQDVVWRVLTAREGPVVDGGLAKALGHADAKVRHLAAEALGKHGTPAAKEALRARLPVEDDARMREVLAVELARVGDEAAALGVLDRKDRFDDLVMREATRVHVLLLSKAPERLEQLLRLAEEPGYPAAALGEVLGGLEGRKEPAVSAFVGASLRHPDPYVRANAVGLVGKNLLAEHLPAVDEALAKATGFAERDVRQAAVETWAAFAAPDAAWAGDKDELKARIGKAAFEDEAATAREAAREAMKKLGVAGAPAEDPLQPNDWQGLPRPKGAVLGVELGAGPEWICEAEILRLAEAIRAQRPEVLFETTAGAFRVAVDPDAAPAHSVSLVLAATAGVYDGTRWHRVVPNFVIQGGDPHGDGNGDGGWSVPDEINERRFVRGELGMPKNTKDTGGCQLFFMHSAYAPLDGRYTAYGRVTAGMEVVDRIRVGDRILSARVVPAGVRDR